MGVFGWKSWVPHNFICLNNVFDALTWLQIPTTAKFPPKTQKMRIFKKWTGKTAVCAPPKPKGRGAARGSYDVYTL